MQKTTSGIKAGALGAVIYFSALLGGYIPLFLLSGYIFLKESNSWLKRAAFKAIVLMLVFSGLIAVIDMLNEILGIFNSLFMLELEIPLELDRVLENIVSIAKTIIFAILGFRALGQEDVRIQTIDNAICSEQDISANVSDKNNFKKE